MQPVINPLLTASNPTTLALKDAARPPLPTVSAPAGIHGNALVSKDGSTTTLSDDALQRARADAGSQPSPLGLQGFAMGQQLLGSLTQNALSLLGIDHTSQSSIHFDAISYDTRESSQMVVGQQTLASATASPSTQLASFSHLQQLSLHGHGTITTADGRSFQFDASLEVAVGTTQQATSTQSTNQPIGLNFAGTAAQLLGNLGESDAGSPLALRQSSGQGASPAVLPATLSLALKDNKGQLLGHIDWQKLLASLQPLVDSLASTSNAADQRTSHVVPASGV
jgi:hypothetical protein